MPSCSFCKKEKPEGDFARQRSNPRGCQAYCRPCAAAKEKLRRLNHPDIKAEDRRTNQAIRKRDPVKRSFVTKRCSARREKLKFSLSLAEYREIMSVEFCPYCGSGFVDWLEPNSRHPQRRSLDQLFPRGGYTTANVVCCCFRCNYTKAGLSADEHRSWADKIDVLVEQKALASPPSPL